MSKYLCSGHTGGEIPVKYDVFRFIIANSFCSLRLLHQHTSCILRLLLSVDGRNTFLNISICTYQLVSTSQISKCREPAFISTVFCLVETREHFKMNLPLEFCFIVLKTCLTHDCLLSVWPWIHLQNLIPQWQTYSKQYQDDASLIG